MSVVYIKIKYLIYIQETMTATNWEHNIVTIELSV